MTNVIQLNEAKAAIANPEVLAAAHTLFRALGPHAARFKHAQKAGVALHIPEAVRKELIHLYAKDGVRLLAELDGGPTAPSQEQD